MWGWFVKGRYHNDIAARYEVSNVVPQHGYRYYLEETGYGSADDASHLFSAPLAEATVEAHCRTGSASRGLGLPRDLPGL